MADSEYITVDWNDTIENKTNDTIPWYDVVGNFTDLNYEDEWHWDSPRFWLYVTLFLLGFLIVINFFVYKICVAVVHRSLCDAFSDLVFFFCTLIASPRVRPGDAEPSVQYKANSTEAFIDGFRPSPFCCFRDSAHEEAETQGRAALAALAISQVVKPQKPRRKSEKEDTVEVRKKKKEASEEKEEEERKVIDLRSKTENTPEEGKGKTTKEEQKGENSGTGEKCKRCMKMETQPVQKGDAFEHNAGNNSNVGKNAEKVPRKAVLQTVPEEQAAVELGTARMGHLAEPMYAVVIKTSSPPPVVENGAVADPEIFI